MRVQRLGFHFRPTLFRDPSGLDVTIWVYPGVAGNPFGHAAISINDGTPIGFIPEPPNTLSGPGKVEPVPSSRVPFEKYTIPTSPDQDALIWDYILRRARDPGNYNWRGRNCTRFVEDALRHGGAGAPDTALPGQLIPLLRSLGR
jgi:hypothetical protein